MELTCAVRTRRSEHNLVSPAPSNDEFVRLLECAATAPDHGRLRPWRWILVRGHGRLTLGNSLAAHCQDEKRDRAAALALRAPLWRRWCSFLSWVIKFHFGNNSLL